VEKVRAPQVGTVWIQVKLNDEDYKNNFNSVMEQLSKENMKDSKRKVCKNCHELGHSITSTNCKLKIEKKEINKKKIQKFMLQQDTLSGKTDEEHFVELSNRLEITEAQCKKIYNEIPIKELLNRPNDIEKYYQQLPQSNCQHCDDVIFNVHKNTNRLWKENTICDTCWLKTKDERDFLWEKIREYKKRECYMCKKVSKSETYNSSERFHYDHKNMFDKGNSICSMVYEGNTIEDIYLEIDKCNIVCLSCHHIITDIESKLSFKRVKSNLTRKLNIEEITEEEYEQEKTEWNKHYKNKMESVYDSLAKYRLKR
tara:strand:+ start:101 stop:1039 length:939 start_codon:yes stop_codon:yes gene_type:complete